MALDMLGQGQKNLNTASGYWNSIFGGDWGKRLAMFSPEMMAANKAGAAGVGAGLRLGGRTGAAGDARLNAQSNNQSVMSNALLGMPGQAAGQIANLGGAQLQTGSSLLGGASSGNLGLLSNQLQQRNSAFDMARGSNLWGNLAQSMQGQDWSKIFAPKPQPGTPAGGNPYPSPGMGGAWEST